MSNMINNYCMNIIDQLRTISIEELTRLLDLIFTELDKNENNEQIDDYCNVVDALNSIYNLMLIDPTIVDHGIFRRLQNQLINILNEWYKSNTKLNDKNTYLFQATIKLFSKMMHHAKIQSGKSFIVFQQWYLNKLFFETIASALADISINSHKYIRDDENLTQLIILIASIQSFQRGDDIIRNNPNVLLLIDPIVKCLCSSTYIDTLKMIEVNATDRTAFENFILGTCPSYCAWYRGRSQIHMITALCENNMLEAYQNIYDSVLPTIDDWKYALTESIYYMTALLRYVPYYPSTRAYIKTNSKLIDSMLLILNSSRLLENILIAEEYNSETNLTDSAISFIFNLTHDFEMLTLIKDAAFFSKDIFLKLRAACIDRVKLHALMILAKILDENDILNLDRVDDLTAVFIDYLYKAIRDPNHTFLDVPIEHLLTSLKAFLQHDEIKVEIFRQNHFDLFIRCAKQKDLHVGLVLQTSLEIIWILAFNNSIRQILLNDYENFSSYLKEILANSNQEGVRAAAEGILWKLENKSNENTTDSKINKQDITNKSYDIMISYSHSNKDLCYQIHQALTNLNYSVWLDFENMYGSTLQSMAEAIESSSIVLVCMSNPYKQSAYCRSEAEYAYTRQRSIIPIVMERKYRPDGWLGIICASKLHVDFTKTDFEQAFQKLISQIQLHQSGIHSSPATKQPQNQPLTHDDSTNLIGHTHEHKDEPQAQTVAQEVISSGEIIYDDRYMEWWTHDDIMQFLQDKNLALMKLLFENEQQFDGRSLYFLYEQSQSNPVATYQSLNLELNHRHDQELPYLTYVHFLSELRKQINPIDIKYRVRYLLWFIWKKIHQKLFP